MNSEIESKDVAQVGHFVRRTELQGSEYIGFCITPGVSQIKFKNGFRQTLNKDPI